MSSTTGGWLARRFQIEELTPAIWAKSAGVWAVEACGFNRRCPHFFDRGTAPELSAVPAGCAPFERSRGTPALVPGIDSPRVVPFVETPVVVGAVALPAVAPLRGEPDELFCADANVLDKASAETKAKVENFIAVTSC